MSRLRFSRALKRSICIEYMQSGKSRKEIAMKYDLPSVNLLSAWIQSCLSPLEIHEKCASLHYQIIVERLNNKTMGNLQSTLYPQKCKNQLLCLFFAPNIWNNQLLCLFLHTK